MPKDEVKICKSCESQSTRFLLLQLLLRWLLLPVDSVPPLNIGQTSIETDVMLENHQTPTEVEQSSDPCAEILHEEEASMANAFLM